MLTGRPIWFIFGMWLAFQENSKKYDSLMKVSLPILIFIAIFLSIKYYRVQNDSAILRYVVGIMFVVFTVIIANLVKPKFLNNISMRFSEYFMPVFVLHTIVSATARTILFKIGITNLFIHIVVGLIVGFAIPMLIYVIAKKIPFLQFFIYPKKAINAIKGKSK
jgi:hypothetical protein